MLTELQTRELRTVHASNHIARNDDTVVCFPTAS